MDLRVSSRLKKLILMLSSPHQGEVASAAAAIDRTLRDEGADWHDLADRLSPSTASHQDPQRDEGWRAVREFCLSRSEALRPRELEFLASLDHWHGPLTEKQTAWLTAIRERLRHPGFF